jgi:hypothetical protein
VPFSFLSLDNNGQAILSRAVLMARIGGFQAGIQLTRDAVLTLSTAGFQYGTGGFLSAE